ncbi:MULTISPECIES: hypothetical protein [unclassified Streptomyces]|uniref:hypothetical protein n=1 Tax=unclassified Streptomyces TaxID=2593676 RepID=UPI0035DC23B6
MRRLRSGTVILGGVSMLAATLTACGSEPDRRCIDPVTYKELPDYQCESGGDGDGSSSSHGGRYYYGGSSSSGKVSGGSFDRSAVDSGGFGGHHSSSGG